VSSLTSADHELRLFVVRPKIYHVIRIAGKLFFLVGNTQEVRRSQSSHSPLNHAVGVLSMGRLAEMITTAISQRFQPFLNPRRKLGVDSGVCHCSSRNPTGVPGSKPNLTANHT
jgi:hypothetical protein